MDLFIVIDHSGVPEFTPAFSGTRVARSLVFYVALCRSLRVLFVLAIVFPASDYPFDIVTFLPS